MFELLESMTFFVHLTLGLINACNLGEVRNYGKLVLVHKSVIVTGINSSLNGANNHMVCSDTDTRQFLKGSSLKILQWPQKIFRQYLNCQMGLIIGCYK